MSISTVNGVRLFWEQHGEQGSPLVLVHGSWGDHHNWDAVVPGLARTLQVFTYDRRGHSQSERLATQGSIEEDVIDLAMFIRTNNLAPTHVAGNSFGAAITLKCVAAQPDLFASVVVHEPPLLGMIQDHPIMPHVRERVRTVVETLKSGDAEMGARQFVEQVALGPGMWAQLPQSARETFVFNAPTWLDETNEPEGVITVDLARLATFPRPMLITQGTTSPPFFGVILDKIAAAVPQARHHTFHGAGHVPHLTHPEEYMKIVRRFIEQGTSAVSANDR